MYTARGKDISIIIVLMEDGDARYVVQFECEDDVVDEKFVGDDRERERT